jgi:hypothetical protein
MKTLQTLTLPRNLLITTGLMLLLVLGFNYPRLIHAQAPWGFPSPTTPMAQRNALNILRSQVTFFQNSTITAPNYLGDAYGMVWQQFQSLRGAYNAFKATLNPQQWSYGANEFAELDAGLDIIQEAFGDYQADVASGQSSSSAFYRMCQDLNEAASVWLQELNRDCNRLNVGW